MNELKMKVTCWDCSLPAMLTADAKESALLHISVSLDAANSSYPSAWTFAINNIGASL